MNLRTKKETKIHYSVLNLSTLYSQLTMHAQVWFLYVKQNMSAIVNLNVRNIMLGTMTSLSPHQKDISLTRKVRYFLKNKQ
jgi:hypothetical protein